jgi:hypothetical protein
VSGTGIFRNVGIGTTTPGPNLEFFISNAGARSAYVANTLLGLQPDGEALINICSVGFWRPFLDQCLAQ